MFPTRNVLGVFACLLVAGGGGGGGGRKQQRRWLTTATTTPTARIVRAIRQYGDVSRTAVPWPARIADRHGDRHGQRCFVGHGGGAGVGHLARRRGHGIGT